MSDSPTIRVIVGVDGSEPSKKALRWAAAVATTTGAELVAIAAWQFPVGYGWSIVPSDWDGESEIRKVLAATTDEVFGSNRPTNMSLRALQGYPSQVLLDESMDALMLVVGSRGHGGFAGLLLGSVSAAVAEHATCPVLVVHGDRLPPAVAA